MAAYLLPHRGGTPHQTSSSSVDIELGLINNASSTEENTTTRREDGTSHPTRLITIPLELRSKIYRFVLVSSDKVVWQGEYTTSKPRSHARGQKYVCNKAQNADDDATAPQGDANISALLLTCRKIHSEAATLFYRRNAFVFKCRTPSHRADPFRFVFFTAPAHPNTLASGLPRAFESPLFRANAQHVTFACTNADAGEAHVFEHTCGLDGAGGGGSSRIAEIVSGCPGLKTLAVHEPESEPAICFSELLRTVVARRALAIFLLFMIGVPAVLGSVNTG